MSHVYKTPQKRYTAEQVTDIRHWQAMVKDQPFNSKVWDEVSLWVTSVADIYGSSEYDQHRQELITENHNKAIL